MQKLRPGDLVRVRHSRWRIVEVRSYEGCQLLTLGSARESGARVERRVIAPFDVVDPIVDHRRPRRVGPCRWRRACRQLLAANTPPGGLRCARHARIDFLPHQLEPAVAILRGLGSRLLLADDVGLGKTVQAGLVIAELRARGCADRVLILTPAGVREQWSAELAHRLDLDAPVVDAADMRQRVTVLPVGINPWTTIPIAIASVDYAKRADVLPSIAACRWDIVVIDEAHNVAGDSDRFHAASALCSRAACVLLLTATPHSGDRRSFASLCGLGAQDEDPLLIFRRTRRDVRLGAVRRVRRLLVRPSPQERRMHALLARFTQAVRDEHGDAGALALSVLHKRALSSARSLERSIERRLTALAIDDAPGASQLLLPLDDGQGELNPADDAPAWDAGCSLADASRERRMLAALTTAANEAAAHETKIHALRRLLRRVGEPAVVFTEYRDTLFHLRAALDRPVVLLHGGLSRAERAAALAEFSSGRCATLLATDAAGEGLNLHQRCRLVVNLELPWNPMRLEQRVGRVDRIGQQRTVHAVHLIARHTGEPQILDRLRARMARARADMNVPDPIGYDEERAVAASMVGASVAADVADAQPAAPPGCAFPDLAKEGIAEAARLTVARALSDGVGTTCDEEPWLLRTRRPVTRARLQSRTLLLLRAVYDDGAGRAVESTLVPVALRGLPLDAIRGAKQLSEIEATLAPLIEPSLEDWRAEALTIAAAFAAGRLRRERAISADARARPRELEQTGLFDRRTDTAAAADAALRQADEGEQRARLDAIERNSIRSPRPPRLVLAIAP